MGICDEKTTPPPPQKSSYLQHLTVVPDRVHHLLPSSHTWLGEAGRQVRTKPGFPIARSPAARGLHPAAGHTLSEGLPMTESYTLPGPLPNKQQFCFKKQASWHVYR